MNIRNLSRRAALFTTALAAFACDSSDESSNPTSHLDGGGAGAPSTADASTPASCLGMALPPHAADPLAGPAPAALPEYFPTTEWKTAKPEDAGMDPDKLTAALAVAPAHTSTEGILVVRHGYVVGERYVSPFGMQSKHESYSMAKSFTSALVGIAIDQGLLSGVDEKICGYYPEWSCAPSDLHSRINVTHTMNVETGIQWSEDWRVGSTARNDTFLASGGMLDYVLAQPMADEPGTKQRYSTGDPSLLSGVLQKVTGKTALDYAREVLLGPMGITNLDWGADSKGRTTTYAGIQATVRDYAKFGLLYLRNGKWDGKQVVPESWIAFTTQAEDPCKDQYRYLWHVNPPLRLGEEDPSCPGFLQCPPESFVDLPASTFFAEGIFGQFIFVVPSEDLVIVRVGKDDLGGEYWDDSGRAVLSAVLAAIVD